MNYPDYTPSKYLTLTWGISRGEYTYGYTICTLTDDQGKAYRTKGGGYDMEGVVLADWLCHRYQAELLANREAVLALYGTYEQDGAIGMDGACGVNSVIKVMRAIGLKVRYENVCGPRRAFKFKRYTIDNA